jgi:outer membrane protein
MKNLSLILNAILLIAVGYLFYENFNHKKAAPAIIASPAAEGGLKIAYVDRDTLFAKYEWLKKQLDAIEQRAQNAESSLVAKQQNLMKDAADLQQRYESGKMTPAEAQKEQQGLQQRGERLQQEQERLSKQLNDQTKKAQDELFANLEAKLKTLSNQIGYDYILSYQRGGNILLANDSLDITKQLLQLLNASAESK